MNIKNKNIKYFLKYHVADITKRCKAVIVNKCHHFHTLESSAHLMHIFRQNTKEHELGHSRKMFGVISS